MKTICVLLFGIIFISCDREEVVRQKFAGVWSITELESVYYKNGREDSVVRYDDLGKLGLFDNAHYGKNLLIAKFDIQPYLLPELFRSMYYFSGNWYWHSDGTSEDRLSLYAEQTGVGLRMYYTFTVEKIKPKTLVLVYTNPDTTNISLPGYRERLTLNRD